MVGVMIARRENDDVHAPQLLVDVRIVDDLADEEDAPIRELPPRLVRVLHRTLDAVAEAELARDAHGYVADSEDPVTLAQHVDDPAGVVRGEVSLHLGAQAEALAEIRLRRGWHA